MLQNLAGDRECSYFWCPEPIRFWIGGSRSVFNGFALRRTHAFTYRGSVYSLETYHSLVLRIQFQKKCTLSALAHSISLIWTKVTGIKQTTPPSPMFVKKQKFRRENIVKHTRRLVTQENIIYGLNFRVIYSRAKMKKSTSKLLLLPILECQTRVILMEPNSFQYHNTHSTIKRTKTKKRTKQDHHSKKTPG